MATEEQQQIFKDAMSNYPTGVTIVTAKSKSGEPVGLTVNSFASVSLDPLMILWSVDDNVTSKNEFFEGSKFAVHLLASDQKDLCYLFASKGNERFTKCVWDLSEHDIPILEGATAVFQCKTVQTVPAGDHTIIIGEVIDLERQEKDPLLYHKRMIAPIPKEFYEE